MLCGPRTPPSPSSRRHQRSDSADLDLLSGSDLDELMDSPKGSPAGRSPFSDASKYCPWDKSDDIEFLCASTPPRGAVGAREPLKNGLQLVKSTSGRFYYRPGKCSTSQREAGGGPAAASLAATRPGLVPRAWSDTVSCPPMRGKSPHSRADPGFGGGRGTSIRPGHAFPAPESPSAGEACCIVASGAERGHLVPGAVPDQCSHGMASAADLDAPVEALAEGPSSEPLPRKVGQSATVVPSREIPMMARSGSTDSQLASSSPPASGGMAGARAETGAPRMQRARSEHHGSRLLTRRDFDGADSAASSPGTPGSHFGPWAASMLRSAEESSLPDATALPPLRIARPIHEDSWAQYGSSWRRSVVSSEGKWNSKLWLRALKARLHKQDEERKARVVERLTAACASRRWHSSETESENCFIPPLGKRDDILPGSSSGQAGQHPLQEICQAQVKVPEDLKHDVVSEVMISKSSSTEVTEAPDEEHHHRPSFSDWSSANEKAPSKRLPHPGPPGSSVHSAQKYEGGQEPERLSFSEWVQPKTGSQRRHSRQRMALAGSVLCTMEV